MKIITNQRDKFAYHFHGDRFIRRDETISAGGYLNCQGARAVILKNIHRQDGIKGAGLYFLITSTTPTDTLDFNNAQSDGSPMLDVIKSGEEAAIRIMQTRHLTLVGLRLECARKLDDKTGLYRFWKQSLQLRSDGPDTDNGNGVHIVRRSIFVGPVEIGRSADPGGAHQRIGLVEFDTCTFTHWPNRKPGVREVIYRNCTGPNNETRDGNRW